jgi:hypothetical protein
MHESPPADLNSYIKHDIAKNVKKIRGKHSPISEIFENVPKSLLIEKIYDLRETEKNFFVFIVKNYSKHPKLRFFLAISLANNSSDLLVQLARDIAVRNDLKLIQYSIFPKTLHVQLLLLKEMIKTEDYTNSIDQLKAFRDGFRIKLRHIKKLIENE